MFYRKTLGIRLRAWLSGFVSKQIARARLRTHYQEEFSRVHPGIRYDLSWRKTNVKVQHNESGLIFGYVAKLLSGFGEAAKNRVLLAGESPKAKPHYAKILGCPESAILTAGLHDGADTRWDFEAAQPPQLGTFGVIVSHANLEHLIDPYRHVCDLVSMMAPGGYLVLYTVLPGFPYHRYPVDCLRFFPDWFVEVAQRNKVEVFDQYIGEDHIVYTYRKA